MNFLYYWLLGNSTQYGEKTAEGGKKSNLGPRVKKEEYNHGSHYSVKETPTLGKLRGILQEKMHSGLPWRIREQPSKGEIHETGVTGAVLEYN